MNQLIPELACAVTEHSGFSFIHHPLIVTIFQGSDFEINQCNASFRRKSELIEKKRRDQDWDGYLTLHERPYRLNAFLVIEDEMSDEEYWKALAWIWVDSEAPSRHKSNRSLWKKLFSDTRSCREVLHNEAEKAFLESLSDDEPVTVYRGGNKKGLSWTTSLEVAEFFASRFDQEEVWSGQIKKKHILAYFEGRGESEVVLDFKNLESVLQI